MTDDRPDGDDHLETGGATAPAGSDDEERQRHVDLINTQLQTGDCIEWESLSQTQQRIVIEHGPNPVFSGLLGGLRDDGWVPTEIDIGDEVTTIIAERVPNMDQRITFDGCPDCGEDAIGFGERDNRGIPREKRMYCTECSAEWTVSFTYNNCDNGCCPFTHEITLDPVYSEEQKIGPASDEYDEITLVHGVDPEAKIEFYQRTRPAETVVVYDSLEDAPEYLTDMLQMISADEDTFGEMAERKEHWEEQLAKLDNEEPNK